MAAERMVIEIELIPDLLVNSVGDTNGAGLGESLEACGDIDAITEDLASVVDDHVARYSAARQSQGRSRRVPGNQPCRWSGFSAAIRPI